MSKVPTDPFPDPRENTPEGIVAIGGDWNADLLFLAYRKGIFPWPQPDTPILWFSPDPRGILDFDDLKISQSLKKFMKKAERFRFTVNADFRGVMRECRVARRPGQDGSWILPQMEPAYFELQKQGRALSIEAWENGDLVGGIYGVQSEKYFSAESMFYKVPNASKLCFLKLVEHLKSNGQTWMDIQMLTPVSESLGGKLIPREEFLLRIGVSRASV